MGGMLRDYKAGVKSFRAQLLVVVGIALVTVAPSLLRPGTMAGDGVDAWGTWWFYWWIRMCVEHFGNPGWTNFFFYPLGKDILAHTGNNFVDAVWSIPFQWVFGPDHYYPVFMAVILVGNADAVAANTHGELGHKLQARGDLAQPHPQTQHSLRARITGADAGERQQIA